MSVESRTIGELREHLVDKATTDETFRAQLIADPKAAIRDELGLAIPDGFTINVHEETVDASHLVLPPHAELGLADLEEAAGGAGNWRYRADGSRYWHEDDSFWTFWD